MTVLRLLYTKHSGLIAAQKANFAPIPNPVLDQVLRDRRCMGQAQSDTARRVDPELHGDTLGRLSEAGAVVRLQGGQCRQLRIGNRLLTKSLIAGLCSPSGSDFTRRSNHSDRLTTSNFIPVFFRPAMIVSHPPDTFGFTMW